MDAQSSGRLCQRAQVFLTDHAKRRVIERTSLSSDRLSELAENAALVYRASEVYQYEVIWSDADKMAYVLVTSRRATNHADKDVITILPIINKNGKPCRLHDPAKPGATATLNTHTLESALSKLGVPRDDAAHILEAIDAYSDAKAPTYLYRWVVRFAFARSDGSVGAKTKTIGKESAIRIIPPDHIIESARTAVQQMNGWDARIELVDRDGTEVFLEYGLY